MGTIFIQRKSEYANRLRGIKIYMDGVEVAQLNNGELKELQIPAGKHTMYAKMDWCSSAVIGFDLTENQTTKFTLSAARNINKIFPIALIFLIIFLIARILTGEYHTLLFSIPIVLLFIYYFVNNKDNYLDLKQVA